MEGLTQLAERLHGALPVSLRHVPDRIRDVAMEAGVRVALTGGLVRDLVRLSLGQISRDDYTQGPQDFDVAVEPVDGVGGIEFAYHLARRLPGRVTVHREMQTARLDCDGIHIDVTTARTEEYPAPGALPEVDATATLEADLPRRDFSVNAIALELAPVPGVLVDPLGGAGDVRDGLIRVLHSNSFLDDPTRLLRAIRYSLRLGYDLEPVTRAAFQQAIEDAVLDCLTPERIRYELERIGREQRWIEIWGIMDLTEITDALAPQLGGSSRFWKLADAAALDIAMGNQREIMSQDQLEPWLVRTAWVLRHLPANKLETAGQRIGLFPTQIRLIVTAREVLQLAGQLATEPRPSHIARLLEQWPRAAVALALFTYVPADDAERLARRQYLRYLDTYCHVRGHLDGHQLIALGARPGPLLGELRDHLRYLNLDGLLRNEAEEVEAAKEQIARLWGEDAGNTPFETSEE